MARIELPTFRCPEFLDKPPTGKLEMDAVPLITMAACLPTLFLFWNKRRYVDLAAYSFGFFVAVIYHMLHLAAHEGLASVSFMGIHGASWRTIDILMANVLLARTMGHALNIDHPIIAIIPNVILPTTLVTLLFALGDKAMGISETSKVTICFLCVTMALQLGSRGLDMLRHISAKYSHPRAMRAATAMAAGIFAFTLPSRQPQNYWIWHSMWHVLMGIGYYDLYLHLLSAEDFASRISPHKHTHPWSPAHQKGAVPAVSDMTTDELRAAITQARAAVAHLTGQGVGSEGVVMGGEGVLGGPLSSDEIGSAQVQQAAGLAADTAAAAATAGRRRAAAAAASRARKSEKEEPKSMSRGRSRSRLAGAAAAEEQAAGPAAAAAGASRRRSRSRAAADGAGDETATTTATTRTLRSRTRRQE